MALRDGRRDAIARAEALQEALPGHPKARPPLREAPRSNAACSSIGRRALRLRSSPPVMRSASVSKSGLDHRDPQCTSAIRPPLRRV
jgi:hypothetical protein